MVCTPIEKSLISLWGIPCIPGHFFYISYNLVLFIFVCLSFTLLFYLLPPWSVSFWFSVWSTLSFYFYVNPTSVLVTFLLYKLGGMYFFVGLRGVYYLFLFPLGLAYGKINGHYTNLCLFCVVYNNFLWTFWKILLFSSFRKSNFKIASIWKKVTFNLLSRHGKTQKTAQIPNTYIRILLNLLDIFAFPILQNLRIHHLWFLFGVTPGVDSYSRHFRSIIKK